MLNFIENHNWESEDKTGIKRRTQQYGWRYIYNTNGDYSEQGKGVAAGSKDELFLGGLPDEF